MTSKDLLDHPNLLKVRLMLSPTCTWNALSPKLEVTVSCCLFLSRTILAIRLASIELSVNDRGRSADFSCPLSAASEPLLVTGGKSVTCQLDSAPRKVPLTELKLSLRECLVDTLIEDLKSPSSKDNTGSVQ